MAEYGVPEIFPILFVVYKNNEFYVRRNNNYY